jgi:hypothetical protein
MMASLGIQGAPLSWEAPELLNVAVVLPLEDTEHGPAPIA